MSKKNKKTTSRYTKTFQEEEKEILNLIGEASNAVMQLLLFHADTISDNYPVDMLGIGELILNGVNEMYKTVELVEEDAIEDPDNYHVYKLINPED
jgi:hypothetical protein